MENCEFTSARLKTKPKWTYARVQIRAKLPEGRGLWPALWMVSIFLILFSDNICIVLHDSYQKQKYMVMTIGQIMVKWI